MSVTVRYTCPHCNAVVSLERPPDLADRSVTTVRQPGWEYAEPDDPDRESADGIEFICGEDGPVTDLEGEPVEGCGRPFYRRSRPSASGLDSEGEGGTLR